MKRLLFIFLLITSIGKAQESPKNHIFNEERLTIIKDTQEVSGIVTLIHPELDGDYHIRLKLDFNQNISLMKKNYTKQDSCLVLEIVCGHTAIYPMSCKCKDYINIIKIPSVGDHIKVKGQFVIDEIHKWVELHPIYDWNLLPNDTLQQLSRVQ